MRWIYKKIALEQEIPVRSVLRNKKLAKYFNRESALGIVCLAALLGDEPLSPSTPIFYDTGTIEYEDFGLEKIVETCVVDGRYSQKAFVERGMSAISPMTQFKILLNMPICFFSIEHQLTGDNAVTYATAEGLLAHARLAASAEDILIGAGKVNADGSIESGFALGTKSELAAFAGRFAHREGIEIFRSLDSGASDG